MDKKLRCLDGVRGCACLIVILAHFIAINQNYAQYVVGAGKIGVWMFFILSSYLLSYPYFKNEKRDINNEWHVFYIKRFMRIYPVYMIVLIIAIGVAYLEGSKQGIKHLALLEGVGHFWSIPVEFKFYIIVPFFLWILTKVCKRNMYRIICLIVLIASSQMLAPFTSYEENSISLKWYIGVFFIGILIAVIQSWYEKQHKKISLKIWNVTGVLVLVGIVLSIPGVRYLVFKIQPDRYLTNKYLFLGIAWGLFLLCVLNGSWIKKVFEVKPLCFIGKISYSLYLIHYIVLLYLNERISSYYLVILLTFVISLVCSIVLYYCVEQPVSRCCNNIVKRVKVKKCYRYVTGICMLLFVSGLFFYSWRSYRIDQHEQQLQATVPEESYESRLYVPTMIKKIEDTYFIVDCWQNRIIYSNELNTDFASWSVLTDKMNAGHTIASDGEIYVTDNTDDSELYVFHKTEQGFMQVQTVTGIEGRPHYVLYDEETDLFYVIGSVNSTIYTLKNNNGLLELESRNELPFLNDLYVRSITIVDGYLYTGSGTKIFKLKYKDMSFDIVESYDVPQELNNVNGISFINGQWYMSINITGEDKVSDLVRTTDLKTLINGDYESVYKQLGFVGTPYYITEIDDKYYITEINEEKGNGIRSFQIDSNQNICNVETFAFWEDVLEQSKQRKEMKQSTSSNAENEVNQVDVMIFMGQSNMSGKGDGSLAPQVLEGSGYEFRAISDPSKLYDITEPFGKNENNQNGVNDIFADTGESRKLGSMVSSFINAYYQETKVPVVGISCSEGATVIDQWQPGGAFLNDAISRLESAKKYLKENNYSIRKTYMVWCQGESDGDNNMSAEEYYHKLKKTISFMVANSDVECGLVVRIGNFNNEPKKYTEIQNAQKQLCDEYEQACLISVKFADMWKHGLMKDEYHYTQEGYNIVGEEAGYNAAVYAEQN